MNMKFKKSELYLLLLLLYCSFRATFEVFIPVIQTLILVLTLIIGSYKFLTRYKYYSKTILGILIINYLYIIANGLFFWNLPTFEKGITHYIVFTLVLFLFADSWDKFEIDRDLNIFSKFNIINACGSIYEAIRGEYILPTSHVQFNDDGRIRTAAFNGDMIALPIILGICALIELYLFIKDKKIHRLFLIFLYYIAILVTQSRGPLVGSVIGMVVFILFLNADKYKKRIWNRKLKKRIAFLICIAALLYIIVVKSNILDGTSLEHFAIRMQSIFIWDNSNGDHSNATRVNLWKYYFEMIKEHPVFGIGIGKTGTDLDVTIGSTESGLVKRFVELGFVGAFINLFFLAVLEIKIVINLIRINGRKKMTALLSFCVSIIVLIEGIILQIDEYYTITTIYWLFVSLAIAKKPNRNSISKEIKDAF